MPVNFPAVEYDKYLPKWLELLRKGNESEKKLALSNLWFLEYPEYRKDPRVFDPILSALKDKNPSIREAAAASLKRIGELSKGCCKETVVPPLIKALEDNNARVREEAAKALAYYKDSRAVDPLIRALKDKDPWVRLNAVYSLGELRAKEAVSPLLELLNDDSDWRNKFVQQECVITIRKIRWITILDKKVTAVLMQKAQDDYLKAEIIKTLGVFQAEEAKDIFIEATKDSDEKVRKEALDALSRLPRRDEKTVQIFKNLLKDPSAEVRTKAVEFLGSPWNNTDVKPLIEALQDSSKKVQEKAIVSLSNYRDEKILDAIVPLFSSEDQHIRNLAAKTFESVTEKTGKERVYIYRKDGIRYISENKSEIPKGVSVNERIIHSNAVDKLINALNNPDPKVKLTVLQIIWGFEDKRIEEQLIRFLDNPSPLIKQRAIALLPNTGGDKAIPRLIEALNSGDRNVRIEAAKALGEYQDRRALEPLIGRLNDNDPGVREATITSLGKFDDPRILDLNIKLLKDESASIRWKAVWNIKEKPNKKATEHLIPLLNDPNTGISFLTAEALGKTGDKRAVEPLIKILDDENKKSHSNLKASAAKSLGLLKDKRAIPVLIKVLTNPKEEPYLRSAAAITLGEIGDPSALEALNSVMNDKNFPYQQNVRDAIKKIEAQKSY